MLHGEIDHLSTLLLTIKEFLSSYGEAEWATGFQDLWKDSQEFMQLNKDERCQFIDRLSNLFGGMESLNDLGICQENGHNVSKSEEKAVNKKLDVLRTELYDIVKNLKQNVR